MTVSQLEKRLSALEAQVADLQRTSKENKSPKNQTQWWNKIAGVFANDPMFDEAMRLGREWRESQRPKAGSKARRTGKEAKHSNGRATR